MSSYRTLAYYYDRLMAHVDYGAWVDFVLERLGYPLYWGDGDLNVKSADGGPPVILDLACGTGNITKLLTERGYRVIGVDQSSDMLEVAAQKISGRIGTYPVFLQQDMTDLTIDRAIDACVCLCDSLNYLIDDGALERTFHNVASMLQSGAGFVFDLHTASRFVEYAESIFAADEGDTAYIWESDYDEIQRLCTMYVTLFIIRNDGDDFSGSDGSLDERQPGPPRLYERYDEVHVERAFTDHEMTKAIDGAGFVLEGTYGELTDHPPELDEGRVFDVLKKR